MSTAFISQTFCFIQGIFYQFLSQAFSLEIRMNTYGAKCNHFIAHFSVLCR